MKSLFTARWQSKIIWNLFRKVSRKIHNWWIQIRRREAMQAISWCLWVNVPSIGLWESTWIRRTRPASRKYRTTPSSRHVESRRFRISWPIPWWKSPLIERPCWWCRICTTTTFTLPTLASFLQCKEDGTLRLKMLKSPKCLRLEVILWIYQICFLEPRNL